MRITNRQMRNLQRAGGSLEAAAETVVACLKKFDSELSNLEIDYEPAFLRLYGKPKVCMCDRCRAVIEWTAAYEHVCKED